MVRHGLYSSHKSDYVEMVFHHICTSTLVIGYLVANIHVIGAFIAVLHDCSDIFMNTARICHGTKWQSTFGIGSLLMMYVTWIWTRLIILPYSIWILEGEAYDSTFTKMEIPQFTVPFLHAMVIFLVCMNFLHYYWFILLSQMVFGYIFKGKADDLQQKIEPVEQDTKKKTN